MRDLTSFRLMDGVSSKNLVSKVINRFLVISVSYSVLRSPFFKYFDIFNEHKFILELRSLIYTKGLISCSEASLNRT